jgi:hypothetical protein
MKIRNTVLRSIEARRYMGPHEHPKKVRIDHNSNITHVSNVEKEQVTIEFQYTASYGPVGVVKLEGSLVFEDANAGKIAEEWKNTRKMPNDVAGHIHTAIMHTCVPEAVGLSRDLGLPPPIPLPQVRLGSQPTKGQAQAGPEVA